MIALKSLKYLGIFLTKEVKDLENYQTLLKKKKKKKRPKDAANEWKDSPSSWNGWYNIAKT